MNDERLDILEVAEPANEYSASLRIGMPWRFFSEEVQERFTQSRFDIIRKFEHITKGAQENESTCIS